MATRTLLLGGIAGPVLFLVAVVVEGATRSGYDPMRQYVSLLSLGDLGWIQIALFIATGVLIAAFGVGLRRTWPVSGAGRWVPRLVVLVGAALAWCGVFVTDPGMGYPAGAPAGLPMDASWHAVLHYLGAVIVFVGLPIAMVIAARTAPWPRSTAWTVDCLVGAVVMVGAWLATFAFAGPDGVNGPAGLLQRIAIVAGFQWLVVTAALALARTATTLDPVAART